MSLLAAHGLALVLTGTSAPAEPDPGSPSVALVQSSPPPPPPPAPPAPPPRGLQLGVGLGYSLPMGTFGSVSEGLGSYISDQETAAVPITLEVGYLFAGTLYVGGSFSWGPGVAPNQAGTCRNAEVSCFEQDLQLLAVARLYFAPRAPTTGWLGLATGWEAATFSTSVGPSTTTATYTGPLMADVRLGVEMRSRSTAIAPYLGVAFGEYLTRGIDPLPTPVSTFIATSLHEWLTLGIRGSYAPPW